MATYAIGDVQGCFDALQRLLHLINYKASRDTLWFCGDLVNRGPQSLAVLRWVYQRRSDIRVVLGNHDLHLLAVVAGTSELRKGDTLDGLLRAKDSNILCNYLRKQPLYYQQNEWLMTHAGVPPGWSVRQLRAEAEFTQALWKLQGNAFFKQMYGNEPSRWQNDLGAMDRARFCINALTRMRYVDRNGALNLKEKGAPGSQARGLMPWFKHPKLKLKNTQVIFGHWATLLGNSTHPQVHALDTGCVWGKQLTALRLEDCVRFSVSG